MKLETVGIIVGAAICLLDLKNEKRKTKDILAKEMLSFLDTVENKTQLVQGEWEWSIEGNLYLTQFTIKRDNIVMYAATYLEKDKTIHYEYRYRKYIDAQYWNIIDGLVDKKVIDRIRNNHMNQEKRRLENLKKDEPIIRELEKALRVLKLRGTW